ncbi:LuxR C-terminal-related transcriptional regulator [Streptomyces sp. NPDC091377]|uniref:helix-turn-helix transcriptional regulator n=1 Tax=Streptomyces sp. NPDC091377 TaxID=3365995 RepID=UPI00381CDC65
MTRVTHHEHGADELCAVGTQMYEHALRHGRVSRTDALAAPCLIELGLLHQAVTDPERLEPVAPALALQRRLHASAQRVADERRRELRLTEALTPLLPLGGETALGAEPGIKVLSGLRQINDALTRTVSEARHELLCVQPYKGLIGRPVDVHTESMRRDQVFLTRGGRIRTLYQHTRRHNPLVIIRYEQLVGDVEARTLDEITERLIIADREVAFLPANTDRSLALELRVPALVTYLATTFDRLWALATPMHPRPVSRPTRNGITPRQHAIARLLVEGHTDAVIAERLGMNVRTARVHIAKLAATLGSESRAQLGYLIARSGILDRED